MDESRRKCFKCGCSPAEHNVKLFRFPKPGVRNLIRCLLWAKYIFPDGQYSSLGYQTKLYNDHRMLCDKHFIDADFKDITKAQLLRTAVPCDMTGRTTSEEESACDGNSVDENTEEKISIKKEHTNDSVCRVCLKEGCIPIHGNKTAEDLSESFNVFAGIEVRIDDPYPKHLCESCNTLLQGAIEFRRCAQQSDETLKHPPEDSIIIDNDDTFNYPEDDNFWESEEHEASNKRIYPCKKCEISFNTFKDYDDHKKTEDHENKKIACPICNNSYTELYFKKHLALHRDKASYMCDICGENFIMPGQFTRHRLTHFYKLPFKCSLCPYKGRFSESLKMHMRSHTGEKPYQCTECPSRFINKSNLNIHTLRHKGEHVFKCETCGRGFYTKRELELHYKVDHTGI